MCNQEGMLRRSCAREVFEDNWSQGGRVSVCVYVCVWEGWRERWETGMEGKIGGQRAVVVKR